ncbi:class I SAM-dependent methyltransferase [Pseudohoeflea coraliihabitans]|uniref:Class I SAM-dependent methyltransferase n=1 Tax=Pseudohoeflea coraliihabitans TaxID=2860393 RepID=A0ABS6WRI8_9HYPH|nr:class I SAM-dependent methyltransferase [Pseudohoeflea sp. DP4N28-3]MBW3098586.1 class I SAM-dependent methyltransferase [Pseudohoeflea sp. DP4N28-3]
MALRRVLMMALKTLLLQGLALIIVWSILRLVPLNAKLVEELPAGAAMIIMLLALGALAAAFGRLLLRLPAAWLMVQLVVPLAVVQAASAPAWLFPVALAVLALIFWNSPLERVPLYLTNRETRSALSQLITDNRSGSFVDLGCGTGGVVLTLARAHPRLICDGLETAPLVYAVARMRKFLARCRNARIGFRSLWRSGLAERDLVYCFLSPAPMAALFAKARAEMRPGSLFVSNSFAVPGVTPEAVIPVGDRRRTQLYLYRIGAE